MTKRIGIEINGVLRDTIGKFKQLYEKHLIDVDLNQSVNTYNLEFDLENSESTDLIEIKEEDPFEYGIISDVTSLDLMNHFKFKSKEEFYSFMYEDYTMELFGHSPSTEINTFNILNEIYYNLRDKYDLLIVSDEIGKSKPSSLFFLSKFGCLIEKVLFYSETTKNKMFDEIDVLLTSNPDLLLNNKTNKILIKYETEYNKHIPYDLSIKSLSEFEEVINKINYDVQNIE
jgi:hypothetical protein